MKSGIESNSAHGDQATENLVKQVIRVAIGLTVIGLCISVYLIPGTIHEIALAFYIMSLIGGLCFSHFTDPKATHPHSIHDGWHGHWMTTCFTTLLVVFTLTASPTVICIGIIIACIFSSEMHEYYGVFESLMQER